MKKKLIFFAILCLFASVVSAKKLPLKLGGGYEFSGNGKTFGKAFTRMYNKNHPGFTKLEINGNLLEAAEKNVQAAVIAASKNREKFDNLAITKERLAITSRIVRDIVKSRNLKLFQNLEFYQIKGEDGKGNVHFTGYYTPVLRVKKEPDTQYKFPIYRMPKMERIPSRKAIDKEGALMGKGLELAYSNDLLGVYLLHVQGSGVLQFPDGKMKKIGYAGQNGHSYKSIGRALVKSGEVSAADISLTAIKNWALKNPERLESLLNQNPSYTFFSWRASGITGAAGVSLVPMHSIAVDKNCIPYGACLLGEVPVLDSSGKLIGHQWRLLFAHDTGGAIRGPGHIDLYHGKGNLAGRQAGALHHYGRLWLLLKK